MTRPVYERCLLLAALSLASCGSPVDNTSQVKTDAIECMQQIPDELWKWTSPFKGVSIADRTRRCTIAALRAASARTDLKAEK